MRGRWAQYRKVLYSAGFDKIHYPGLTIIRRLFFRQTIFDWQVFESTFEWQKKYFTDSGETRILNQKTNQRTGRQTKNQGFCFYPDKKTVFIFHVRQIFWQKLFHNLRNYFWRRERWRQFFHLFIFRFDQTMGLFFLWTQIFNSKKNDKSFFTFFMALFGRTKKYLRTLFGGQRNL